jgi:outer membrane protein assembly factor BamB
MDVFQITLAGRWRGPAGEVDERRPEALVDHIDLRLGELGLTAHLGDDAVFPFLTALARALVALADGGTAEIHLSPSAHVLRLVRRRTQCLVSFVTESGRPIVRNAPTDFEVLRRSAHQAGTRFVAEVLALQPAWQGRQVVRRLRAALADVVRSGRGEVARTPVPDAGAAPPRRPVRPRPAAFPLHVSGVGLRFGAQPASTESGGGRRGVLHRLFDAFETLAREPGRRLALAWSITPRTSLTLARQGPDQLLWTLRDAAAPWMSGQASWTAVLTSLRRATAQLADFDPAEAKLRLGAIRRWLRAERMPTMYGAAVLLPPSPPNLRPDDGPLATRRLFHVAFRRLWRRPLRRFFLPPQVLGGGAILVHTAEGLLGLSRETGREAWRHAGAHPLLAGGPPELLLDARARLMCIDDDSGAIQWRHPRPWRRAPAVAVQRDALGIVVLTEAGDVVGLASDGGPQFETRLMAGTAHGLTTSPALLWVPGEDAHLTAFRRGDGALHFRVPLGGHAVGAPLRTPAGLVVAVERGTRTHLLVFDAATGHLTGETQLPGLVQSLQALGASDESALAVQTQTDEGTATAVVDARTGRVRFTLPAGPWRSSLTVYQGVLCIGGHGGCVSAYDALDGSPLWAQPADAGGDEQAAHVRPLGVRGLLYVLGGGLCILEPATGRVVSRHALEEFEVGTWLVSAEGDVLMADPERALTYLRLSGHLSRVD